MQQSLTEDQKLLLLKSKKLPGSGFGSLILFLINIFVTLPVWLFVLLPFTILFVIVSKIMSICGIGKRRRREQAFPNITNVASDKKAGGDRKYDVILFGATGFTGSLVAEYLAKNYSNNLRWAIAGRQEKKLQEVKDKLSSSNPQLASLQILIADSSNKESLTKLVNDTKVILTTVGPYERYGTQLLALCAEYGTDYVDITGEVAWVRQMITQYGQLAEKSGARIINCCGLDCIPWDLLTLATALKLQKEHKQELAKIEFFDELGLLPSGGTLETLINSLDNPPKKSKEGDPLLLVPGSKQVSDIKFKTRIQRRMGFSSKFKSWIGLWMLADGNSAIVKRSNCINKYNSSTSNEKCLQYCEALVYPNFFAAVNATFQFIILGTCVYNKWLRKLTFGTIFPKPGQGATRQQMEDGFLRLTAFGTGTAGQKTKIVFTQPVDPGYLDTARLVAESALSFVFNEKEIKKGGGFWTPATCQGEVLIKRLVETGSTLRYL